MKIIAMIPARSGSKGLPNKNIKPLCGKPLLCYAIEAALNAQKNTGIANIYLNSDSKQYLRHGEDGGIKTFSREKKYAGDAVSIKDVVVDFVSKLEESCDAIIVLYPVYPIRSSEDIVNVLYNYHNVHGEYSSLIGIKKATTHPYLCYHKYQNKIRSWMNIDANLYYRRQDYPEAFQVCHWACVVPIRSLHNLNAQLVDEDTFGYVIEDTWKTIDVDSRRDFELAEFLLEKRFSTEVAKSGKTIWL